MTQKKKKNIFQWVLTLSWRVFFYSGMAVLLVGVLAFSYLQSEDFEILILNQIETALKESLDSKVSVSDLRFDLLNRKVILADIEIYPATGNENQKPLSIDLLVISASLLDALGGKLNLKNVVILNPEVKILFSEQGIINLPSFASTDEKASEMNIRIQHVDVYGGSFIINGINTRWNISSGSLRLEARNFGQNTYRGFSSIQNLSFMTPVSRRRVMDMDISFKATSESLNLRAEVKDNSGNDFAFNTFNYSFAANEVDASVDVFANLANLDLGEEFPTEGTADISATIISSEKGLNISGTVDAREVHAGIYYADYLYSAFSYEGNSIQLSDLRTALEDGYINADISIDQLTSNPVIDVSATLQDFDLAEMLVKADLEMIRIESVARGQIDFRYDSTAENPISGSLHLIGETLPETEEQWLNDVAITRQERNYQVLEKAIVPISFDIKMESNNGKFVVSDGSFVNLPESKLKLAGELKRDNNFEFIFTTNRIDSIEAALALTNIDRFYGSAFPELEQVYGVASFLRQFDGYGNFEYVLRGPVENMTYELTLLSESIKLAGNDIGGGIGQISYADMVISLDKLEFYLDGGYLEVGGKVNLPPAGSLPTVPPQIDLFVSARNINLSKYQWVFGQAEDALTVNGRAFGEFDLSFDDPANLAGKGFIQVFNPEIDGILSKSADFDLEFGEEWKLSNLTIIGMEDEEITGAISINPLSQEWSADISITRLDLSRYARLLGEDLDMGGVVKLDMEMRGQRLQADGTIEFNVNDLSFQKSDFGNISGTYKGDGRNGLLDVETVFGQFAFTTAVVGDKLNHLRLELASDELDLSGTLAKLLGDEKFFGSIYDGMIVDLIQAEDGSVTTNVEIGNLLFGFDQFTITGESIKMSVLPDNIINFSEIKLMQGGMLGDSTTLSGSIEMSEGGVIDLNLKGAINLFTINDFFPDFTISGESQIDTRIVGTFDDPVLNGTLTISDAFIRHKSSDLSFADINGEIIFENDNIYLAPMTARFSQGNVILDGEVEFNWSALEPLNYRFTAEAMNLRYNPEPGISAVLEGVLALHGNASETNISGDITLVNASFTKRFDPEAELARLSAPPPTPVDTEALKKIKLDVGIRGSENIAIINNLATMNLALDLRATGNLAEFGMLGRAEVVNGEVFYRDRKYTVNSGVIDFINPRKIEPQFDFRTETQVKEYRILLNFFGTLDRMYPELSSDPALNEIDILHLLAVGKVRDNPVARESEDLQSRLMQLGLSGFLTKQITGELEKRAEQIFGIDRFRIDPFMLEDSENIAARMTIGDQLTDDLSVIYSSNLSKDDQQVLVFEYRLSPSLLLVGTREEDGSYAVDIHLQKKFR